MIKETIPTEKLTREQYVEVRLHKFTCFRVKTLAALGALLLYAHGFIDYFLNPGNFLDFQASCIAGAFLLLIIYAVTFMKQDKSYQYKLAFIGTLVAAVTIEIMIMSSGGHESSSYVGMNLLVITVLGLIPFNIVWSVVTVLAVYLVYLVPILVFTSITGWSGFIESNIFVVATFSIAIVWRTKTQRDMINGFEMSYELASDKHEIEDNIKKLNSAFDIFSHIATEVEKKKEVDVSSYQPIDNSSIPVCWEVKDCDKTDCPVHGQKNMRCWQVAGTHCGGVVQGKFARKIGACKNCEVYLQSTGDQILELVETFNNMMHILGSTHKELKEANQIANEANKHKSEFLANMSHEIRTPMNAIMGMASLMQNTELSEEQRDYIDTLQMSAMNLLNLINDILDFSKIEAGKLDLDIIDFNLREVVEGVADTLAPQASEKGLELACLFPNNVPKLLRGDPIRIHQTLLNFGSNAIKFTDKGEVFICIELKNETEQNAEIIISVVDTGMGIPEDKQKLIFKEFTQADGSTTRTHGGTGLGLSISAKLVKLMDGEIGVKSELGKGSNFWFSVFLEKQEKGRAEAVERIHSCMKDMRVLVVDDNQTNRIILEKMLENFGCVVETASSGAKAIKMLKSAARSGNKYQLLLLDMMMPGMNGEHTTIIIKNTPAISDVPVVILTSIGGVGDVSHMREIGCDGYLVKPVKQSLLLDTITTILGNKYEAITITHEGEVTDSVVNSEILRDVNILLVEDHPVNQKTASIMLTKAGYLVDIAENGRIAVEMVEKKEYDLVLMDIQMPEMDGYEATGIIRARDGESKHTIIIAMTAHSMQGDRERCIEAGMDDYLPKPINQPEMFNVIGKWTNGKTDFAESGFLHEEIEKESPVNLKSAMTRFRNDKGFFKEMVVEFLNYVPEQIKVLEDATSSEDAEGVQRNAHSIKGAAGNLSADRLHAIALNIENSGRIGNVYDVPSMISDLKAEVLCLKEFVKEF